MPKCTNCQDDYKCILHCEKDDKWMNMESNISEFWKKIREELFDSLVKREDTHIFENIVFPRYEQEKSRDPNLEPVPSDDDINFSTSGQVYDYSGSINSIGTKILFKKCTFLDKLDLDTNIFKNTISFSDNCIFKKGINFNEKYKSNIIIDKCDFKGNEIDLSSRTFNSSFYLKNSFNISNLDCSYMDCKKDFTLVNTTVNKANFDNAKFKELAVFNKATFISDVNFEYTRFDKLVLFRETIFEGSINLEDALIKEEVNFLGVNKGKKKKLESKNIANRETARIIKHSFEKQDNIIEANKFYALEMEKERKNLNLSNFSEWLVFQIHRFSSNHSQSYFLSLVWIINIGLLAYIIDEKYFGDAFIGFAIYLLLFMMLAWEVNNKKEFFLAISILIYLSFSFLIDEKTSLDGLSQQISPFSKLGTDMTAIDFIAKVIIAYLIYQFVVSVRQNTRRT